MNNKKVGKVYLVGAGPGDYKLLTLKALEILNNADVIVYDRLVSDKIISKIPAHVIKINVGKNVGNHPVPQHEINNILLEKALEGYNVVRLKGGDSFVFGRGGEELELLYENNIEFQVIPGITSAVAVGTYAGIPVTHRDFCSSLHIITGHVQRDGKLNIDFKSLVKLEGTLVFMMSVGSIGKIASGLMEQGMDLDMPCAVVENGTRENQRKFIGSISHIESIIKENNVKSPAIIYVGKVCTLSEKFDWFSSLPLKGCNILVTRPQRISGKLAEKLYNLGADVTEIPFIETNPIPIEDFNIENYNFIIFTSAFGVEVFFKKLYSFGTDSRVFSGKKLAVVGNETAKELLKYGIIADFVPKIFSGEEMGKEMIENRIISEKDKALIFRAKEGSKELTEIFDKNNIDYKEVAAYETVILENKGININNYNFVTFTSASCVKGFVQSVRNDFDFSQVQGVCIGEQTAKTAREHKINVCISKEASIDSMVELICDKQSSAKYKD